MQSVEQIMIYLTCMGEIYKISKKGYRSYIKQIAMDGSSDLLSHGAKLVSRKLHNVTDITREEAQLIYSGGMVSTLPTLK